MHHIQTNPNYHQTITKRKSGNLVRTYKDYSFLRFYWYDTNYRLLSPFELSTAVARAFKITHLCKRYILHLQGYTFLYRFLDLFSFFKAAKWSSNNPFGISYEINNWKRKLASLSWKYKNSMLAVIENKNIHCKCKKEMTDQHLIPWTPLGIHLSHVYCPPPW